MTEKPFQVASYRRRAKFCSDQWSSGRLYQPSLEFTEMQRLRPRLLTCFYCGRRSDTRFDGVTRQFLGFEVVDVIRQPTPSDITVELGELGKLESDLKIYSNAKTDTS